MDQTFFVFLILFAIIIIYLFKQKNDHDEMKDNLTEYINQENFQNNAVVEINKFDLIKNSQPEIPSENNTNPEPMNKPIAPVGNGYSTTLTYTHPNNINGCDISTIAPMDYYKEINNKLNNQFNNKVMNGDSFGDVTGYTNESEEDYFYF